MGKFDLPAKQLLRAYKEMLLARKTDEKSIVLYKQNKCHFQISCAGHEAIQVAAAHAMNPKSDWAYPYYRDMAFCVAWGMTCKELLLNALNKPSDPNSSGRQMPMHYGHKDLQIVSQSSPTGTQFLQAVGAALAIRFRNREEKEPESVVYVSAGEGTCAQGDYHEALNWAAREKLPVIFVIQDNQYAISVHISEQHAGKSVAQISKGYLGLEIIEVDGLNYLESYEAMKIATDRARSGSGPTLVVAKVVRLQSHSISDNQAKYRDSKELEEDKELDPISLLKTHLIENKVSTIEEITELETTISNQVNQDSEWAENQPDHDPKSALDFIFSEPHSTSKEENLEVFELQDKAKQDELFMVDALNRALDEEMSLNSEMVIFGEDVAHGKGGVFSVTQGLTAKYGKHRCFNSPLAESSIAGTAIGMATLGMKPVVEIQFGDYIWTAMMQIVNELATMSYRSAGNFTCPAVIRAAVGGYIQGGIYHSQNIEATFAHFPGLHVIYPSNAIDAKGLLKSAIRCNQPVLFLEHKGLYRQVYAKGVVGGIDHLTPIGKAKIVKTGRDATIITWGALVQKSIVAAQTLKEEGYEIEIIDIRTIAPLDSETILNSIKKTNRAIIAHEDKIFSGFGAEISAQIAELAFESLDAPIIRVAGKHCHIPHSGILEQEILPQTNDIIDALKKLLRY
jgi:2-oxoisovalerate dehydrogenase E1 component